MNNKFDLLARTNNIGKEIIRFCKIIDQNAINRPLISQLIRSGTSIGANYSEACECNSKRDFIHKISICKKEAKETIHWLDMITEAVPDKKLETDRMSKEVHELLLIFSASIRTSKNNEN